MKSDRAPLALVLAASLAANAATASASEGEATVRSVSGEVTLIRTTGAKRKSLTPTKAQSLLAGDRLLTGAGGSAVLTFSDGSEATLRPESEIVLGARAMNPTLAPTLLLLIGRVHAKVAKAVSASGNSFEVLTMNAVAGVRGTDFELISTGDECEILVHEGLVSVVGLEGPEVLVGAKHQGAVTFDEPAQFEVIRIERTSEMRIATMLARSEERLAQRSVRLEQLADTTESRLEEALRAEEEGAEKVEALVRGLELAKRSGDRGTTDRLLDDLERASGPLLVRAGAAQTQSLKLFAFRHRLRRAKQGVTGATDHGLEVEMERAERRLRLRAVDREGRLSRFVDRMRRVAKWRRPKR